MSASFQKSSLSLVWFGLRPRTDRVGLNIDSGERFLDLVAVIRPHELRCLLAVAQEDERRPELHAEGAAKALAARVGDLDVAHARVLRDRLGDQRLRAPAPAAPRAAELEQRRSLERVDLGALGLDRGVIGAHQA